jgi:hypothetical protein
MSTSVITGFIGFFVGFAAAGVIFKIYMDSKAAK